MTGSAAACLAAVSIDDRRVGDLKKIASGVGYAGPFGAATQAQKNILKHIVYVNDRHTPSEISADVGNEWSYFLEKIRSRIVRAILPIVGPDIFRTYIIMGLIIVC
tara:strand:- start:11307 stop:11624 length:318 start_codon:yes stop_codon:yes gene_type:complete